jgi:Fur family peroxide stress response transcriptional regulator
MRYDSITKVHHHIYYAGSEKIEDYFDEELDNLLWKYFEQKKIPDFQLKDIRLQIIGDSTSIHIKP